MTARYVAKKEVSHRCARVKLSTKGGIAPFWGDANLAEKVSRDVGYRSGSIAISRDIRAHTKGVVRQHASKKGS